MPIRLLQMLIFTLAVECTAVGKLPGPLQVLWSHFTPPEMLEATFACESQTGALFNVEYSPLSTPLPLPLPNVAVLDVLWSEPLSRLYLSSRTSEVAVTNGNNYELEHTTALDLDINRELEQLSRVSEWLGVKRLCLFLTPQSKLLPTIHALFADVQIEVLRVSEGAGSTALEVLVRKQIAPFGFTSFLILLPPLNTKKLLLAFSSTRLTTNRLIVLLSSQASAYRFNITEEELSGFIYLSPLFVTRRECHDVETAAELLLCQVSQAVTNPTSSEVSLMQIANRTVKSVGRIYEEGVDLSNYQEAEIQPNSSRVLSTIHISINSGRGNPSGLSLYDPASEASGAMLAVQDINAHTTILPYFNLELRNESFGVEEFNATWVKQQIAQTDLGVVLIDGLFSTIAMGVYKVLESLNYSIPQVGAVNVYSALSSISQFPLFTRVAMPSTYITGIHARVVKSFGWKRMNVLLANDTWDDGLTEYFFSLSKELGIEVVNNNNRIPSGVQSNSTELLKVLEEVVESKVKILVILAYRNLIGEVMVGLYNLGLRRGDLIVLAIDWISPTLYDIEDPKKLQMIKELTQGALMFIPSSFVGPIGATVYQKYVDNYGAAPPAESCSYYDAGMIVAQALDYMTSRGENWFSSIHLNKAIRRARFVGCTGLVYIEDNTNDRALMSYAIVNAQLQVDGSMKLQTIGTYDPSSAIIFNFTEAIQWPGGGTSIPREMRENLPGCPFEQKDAIDYQPAMAVATTLISCVCLISFCCAVFIWKRYWNEQVIPEMTRVDASFEDYFVFITMAIETAQFVGVGLKLGDWAVLLKWGANILVVRFEAFSSTGSAGYWVIFYLAVAIVALWIMLITLSQLKTNRFFKCIYSRCTFLTQSVCPLLGEVCFLPIISVLLAIFQCPKIVSKVTESATLKKAYLEWDCNQFCWSGPHLPFAVASFWCLLVYIPSAAFMRPAWQFIPFSLHICTSPSFLMLKTIYQVAIAGVDRILKTENSLYATVIFAILTLLFGIGTLKVRPYNYSRANLWHFLSLFFILHTSILHIASDQFPEVSSSLWLILLLLGLGVVSVFGLIYQAVKLPMLLASKKSIKVTDLFRFMFARNGRYLHIFSKVEVDRNEISPGRRVALASN